MTGVDAAFIYDERPHEPQHTLKIAIWSPQATARYSLESARRLVASRLPVIPPLRWRAIRVPLDLHHPVWVEAGSDIDLAHHVRRLGIPAPAGRRELCEVISEIASQPLDPARPLWELWMLEGYEGDKVVAVLKMSHALADGGEARTMIERLYDERPVDAIKSSETPLPTDVVPSRRTLLRLALRDRGRELVHDLPRLARRSFRVWRRSRAGREEHYAGPRVKLLDSPPTPLGGRLSRRRAFYFTSFSLDEAKHVRRAFDCTINDVVLATAAGALRRYLIHHRALPGLPTIAHMPASIREDDERGCFGNRITTRSITLPSHLADPVLRLRAASQIAREAKADLALRRGANLEDWLRWLPPFGAKWLSRSLRLLMRLLPEIPGGVAVSNVPGPAKQLHSLGGPVERFVSVGHMKYAAGLNMTVWSYAGQLNAGLYTCAEAVPDLWRFAEFVNESFEELRKAAARESARVPTPGPVGPTP